MKPELSKKTKALIDPHHTALLIVLSAFSPAGLSPRRVTSADFFTSSLEKFFALRKPSACLNQGLS